MEGPIFGTPQKNVKYTRNVQGVLKFQWDKMWGKGEWAEFVKSIVCFLNSVAEVIKFCEVRSEY